MSDKKIEKVFPYLLVISLLIHAGFIALTILVLREKKVVPPVSYMVELRDPPPPAPLRSSHQLDHSPADKRAAAPEKPTPLLPVIPGPSAPVPGRDSSARVPSVKKSPPAEGTQPEIIVRRRNDATPDLARLFPSAQKQARIEENYREKYAETVGGDTLFLDKDDELMGSYSRRFLEAVRSKWNVVGGQLLLGNNKGYGLVLIVINRSGVVEDVSVMETSGNKKVDDEIMQTIRTAGYVGPLPKKWPHERMKAYYIYSAGYELNY